MRWVTAFLVLAPMLYACQSTPPAQTSRWPAFVGKWTKLGEVPLGGLYYDSNSVTGTEETKRITVLIDYRDKRLREDREILSSQYLVTVDCVNRVLAANTQSGYSGQMGAGKALFASFYNRRYQPPDWDPRLFKDIFGIVCKAQG